MSVLYLQGRFDTGRMRYQADVGAFFFKKKIQFCFFFYHNYFYCILRLFVQS